MEKIVSFCRFLRPQPGTRHRRAQQDGWRRFQVVAVHVVSAIDVTGAYRKFIPTKIAIQFHWRNCVQNKWMGQGSKSWRQPFYIIIYHHCSSLLFPQPIGSMYGIYANIGGILMVNVTIYSIHGSYGQYFIEHPHRINQLRCPNAMAFHAGIFCFSWRPARKSSKPHRSFIASILCTHPESTNVIYGWCIQSWLQIMVCA